MSPEPGGQSAVVDTDVLSFWHRPDTRSAAYADELRDRLLIISVQTVAEQLRWAAQSRWGEARTAVLEAYLERFVVVPYSYPLAKHWAAIMAETSRAGFSMGVADAWVAATARMLDIPVATHNRRHFERVAGLRVITFAPG